MYWVPRFHNIVCSESTKLYTHETCQLIETKVSSRDSDTTADYWLPLVCLNEYIYIYIYWLSDTIGTYLAQTKKIGPRKCIHPGESGDWTFWPLTG